MDNCHGYCDIPGTSRYLQISSTGGSRDVHMSAPWTSMRYPRREYPYHLHGISHGHPIKFHEILPLPRISHGLSLSELMLTPPRKSQDIPPDIKNHMPHQST